MTTESIYTDDIVKSDHNCNQVLTAAAAADGGSCWCDGVRACLDDCFALKGHENACHTQEDAAQDFVTFFGHDCTFAMLCSSFCLLQGDRAMVVSVFQPGVHYKSRGGRGVGPAY